MKGEWREIALGDVADEITVGHVGAMASEYVTEGIPFLRSQILDHCVSMMQILSLLIPSFTSV